MKKGKIIASTALVTAMVASSVVPAFAYTKDETVYSKLNTDGSTKTTLVSEHLKNTDNLDSLEDISTLAKIVNVNGNEKFDQSGDSLVWASKGNDIFYQGKTDKELPISEKITYKLDGKDIKLKDLLGKKGDVEINIEYTNNVVQDVNGSTLYTPFVVTTATMIPTSGNSNVAVTNGKVVSNGTKNIVVGIAAPGLSQDYDNNEDLAKLNSTTISYTTKKFKLNSLMTVATPDLLKEDDLKVFDQVDDVYSMVDKLTSSYSQILSGGKTLESSMKEFASKYSQFNDGVNSLSSGAQELNSGISQVYQNLVNLDSNSATLNGGAKQTFNVLLNSATTQLQAQLATSGTGLTVETLTISNYKDQLNGLLTKIAGATTQQVTEKVKQEVKAQVELNIKDAIKKQAKQGVIQALVNNDGKTEAEATAYVETTDGIAMVDSAYETALESAQSDGSYETLVATKLEQQMASAEVQAQIQANVAQHTTGDAASSYMSIFNLLTSLETYNQFYVGIQQYTGAVGQLKEGTKKLVGGANTLVSGTQALASNSALLNEAAGKLSNGASTLASGLTQFDEQGISKIADVINNDIKNNVEKTETLLNLSKDYQTFTEKKDGNDGITKFVMVVDSKSK